MISLAPAIALFGQLKLQTGAQLGLALISSKWLSRQPCCRALQTQA